MAVLLAGGGSAVLADQAGVGLPAKATRQWVASERYLLFPIKNGAPKQRVRLVVDGQAEAPNVMELAPGTPDWWAFRDITDLRGKTITLEADNLPADNAGWQAIRQGNEIKGGEDIYRERLRPQFHFSARRGWNNDPNGLAFYGGEYHLFFQHNPYGWSWGNMHWGHATSPDLVHWSEQAEALRPDALGTMYSGSAVTDWNNTSGLGQGGKPPLVLVYTAAGNPMTQCLAYSRDGRSFTKYAGNPVVTQFTPGNRDPKVRWYEPARKWVMVLYVGYADPAKKDAMGKPGRRDTIRFLSSTDLKSWQTMSEIEGFYECPDLFPLPLTGDPGGEKWVLTAANSDYMIGRFDGTAFIPETSKLTGQRGEGFYAAQTYSDEPKQRRIQIGWMQAPAPGMAFNQTMSLPLELSLRATPEGLRLARLPVPELESLRQKAWHHEALSLQPGGVNPLAKVRGELLEVRADFEPGAAAETVFTVNGATVVYDADQQELTVNGKRNRAPLMAGHERLILYADRTTLEVFANDGLVYAPMPVLPPANQVVPAVTVKGGAVKFDTLDAWRLKSAWK